MNLKKSFHAFLGLTALIGLITLITPQTIYTAPESDKAIPVSVVNSPNVNAQQAGAWNVGINGTPTMNLADGATIGIDPNSNSVQIANTAANPLTVQVVDQSAGQYLYAKAIVHLNPGDTSASAKFFTENAQLSVPVGKRLIVEHLSCSARVNQGQKAMVALHNRVDGLLFGSEEYFFAVNEQGTFSFANEEGTYPADAVGFSQPIKMEVGANSLGFFVFFERNGSLKDAELRCGIFGHLVDHVPSPNN